MARATRIALDMALVSLRTIRPAVSSLWLSAKNAITNTAVKPLVVNSVVDATESVLERISDKLDSLITTLRDRQLPKEQVYLEKELEKVKEKISKSKSSKTLKSSSAIAWQYAKVEVMPPLTQNFFQGASGRALESAFSNAANNFIGGIQNRIKEMEADQIREIKRKEAEVRAAQEKIKAEAKRKAEEFKRKEAEKLAKEVKAKKQADAQKVEKKKEATDTKKEQPVKKKPKKKVVKRKGSKKPRK